MTPLVDLFEFEGLGVIVAWRTGVMYTNQVAGHACLHPQIEGTFVPLFDGIGHPVLHALSQSFLGSWKPVTSEDADIIDAVLRSAHLDFITVDRNKLAESYEAWIHIDIREQPPEETAPILSGFGVQKGVLTWPNSD